MISSPSLSRIARVELSLLELHEKGTVIILLKGNCMWPVVRDGDLVTIKKVPYAHLRYGDVAIFQTTPETFHANTQFRNLKAHERDSPPKNYVGQIIQVKRNNEELNLSSRALGIRVLQALLSPANPYGLSLPQTLLRKFGKKS